MKGRRLILGLIFPVLFLAAWEIFARAGVLSDDVFSRISKIVPAAAEGLADGSIWLRTYETLAAAIFGWAIAAAIGIPLGLVLGLVRPLERLTAVTIEALRPVPSAALIPIVLLIFGFSLQLDATVAAFACVWPVLIVTTGAVRAIEPRLLEVGRALGYGALARIWHFALPAALPGIAVGLRVAFGIAIVVTVTVEIAANPRGLGYAMITAQQSLRAEVMYAYLFWIGIVGWLINVAMVRTERRVLRWYWGGARMNTVWRLASFAFAAGLIALWQVLADAGLISRVFFPAPSRAFDVLWEWIGTNELWGPLAGTIWRTLVGWLGATLLGVVLGAAIASSPVSRDLFEPTVEFLRPLPSSAMIPPAILLLGLTDGMVVAVVIFGSIWPILLGAIHGFRSVEPRLLELARSLRMSRLHRIRRISLPNALPEIFAGMRVSFAIALIITVVAEMLSSRPGLGQMIHLASRAFRSPEIFAGVFVLGALGYIGNTILERLEAHFLRWRPQIGVA